MHHPSASRRLAACTLLASVGAIATAASAGVPTIPERFTMQNAVSDCQGALPAFEGAIRKRPTGMANEGGANAFVTCSMQGEVWNTPAANTWFGVGFANRGAASATINCTAVLGFFGLQTSMTKSITLAAGGRGEVSWSASTDNGGVPYPGPVNFSCALPPGSEANYTYRRFYINE